MDEQYSNPEQHQPNQGQPPSVTTPVEASTTAEGKSEEINLVELRAATREKLGELPVSGEARTAEAPIDEHGNPDLNKLMEQLGPKPPEES